MKIHTVGCSFTYAQQIGWPLMLSNKIKERYGIDVSLMNSGHPGAGNGYIGNKPMLEAQFANNHPDLVVIMWSGLTRKDIAVDHTDEILMNTLEEYKDYVRWTGRNTSYILSGGMHGSWSMYYSTKQIFSPLYKISNERSMAQDTLVQILSTQNYLKQNNIPYIMSSYVNYWNDADIVGQVDFGIRKYPDLDYLVDQIDFSQWVFVNENKDCIYELAKSTPNGLEEDGFHPDLPVHELWSDLLMQHIEKNKLI